MFKTPRLLWNHILRLTFLCVHSRRLLNKFYSTNKDERELVALTENISGLMGNKFPGNTNQLLEALDVDGDGVVGRLNWNLHHHGRPVALFALLFGPPDVLTCWRRLLHKCSRNESARFWRVHGYLPWLSYGVLPRIQASRQVPFKSQYSDVFHHE